MVRIIPHQEDTVSMLILEECEATVCDLGERCMNSDATDVDRANYKSSIKASFALRSKFGCETEIHASDWHVSNWMVQGIKDCGKTRLVDFQDFAKSEESHYRRVKKGRDSFIKSMSTASPFLSNIKAAIEAWWPTCPFIMGMGLGFLLPEMLWS